MYFFDNLQLISPMMYQQVSAAATWSAVTSGMGEMIQSGHTRLTGAWAPGNPSEPAYMENIRDPHEGFWVGATTNIAGSMSAEAYVVSVLVLDYPITLPAKFETLYGLLGSIYLKAARSSLGCAPTIATGYWPSSRLHNNANLRIYLKYLGVYDAPYTDPNLTFWFTPNYLSTLPTLSGPLGARDIRTRWADAEHDSDAVATCGSSRVYRGSIYLPYFIPFTESATLGTIMADLDAANSSSPNPRYASNVRFLRLLLVTNHLIEDVPPAGDETFLAATTVDFHGPNACYRYLAAFPPALMPAMREQALVFNIRGQGGASPTVESETYEAPSGYSDYTSTLLERGGYVVDATARFVDENLIYSEARPFIGVHSDPARPLLGTLAPYGDSLVSPVGDRYMETPAEPSATIVVDGESPATWSLLYGGEWPGSVLLQAGWSQMGYIGGEDVPYASYFSAYPSIGTLLGDGGDTYTLYPAPTFSLAIPAGSVVALGLGANVAGGTVNMVVANGVLVWG